MIDLSRYSIENYTHSEIKKLCKEMYAFVASEENVNLFKLNRQFYLTDTNEFRIALDILLSNHCLLNGSRGYRLGTQPEFFDDVRRIKSEEIGIQSEEKEQERMKYIREVDTNAFNILSDESFYNPLCIVERKIETMSKGTPKTILEAFFIKKVDFDILEKTYRNQAQSVILDFSKKFSRDPTDWYYFNAYDLSSNVMIYLFNRSEAYYRLFFINDDPGYGEFSECIFPPREEFAKTISCTPNSSEKFNLLNRAMEYIDKYQTEYGKGAKTFVAALMALLNNTSIKKTRVKEIYARYSGLSKYDLPSENEWMFIFDNYIDFSGKVKFLSYDNIKAVREIISNIRELQYGISVDKAFKSNEKELRAYYIDSGEELNDFITKYTTYKIYRGRILIRDSLKEALQDFVSDIQVYDLNRLLKLYTRKCGGPAKEIAPILKTLDMGQFVNENPLTDDEEKALIERFSKFEWISKENARSIFSDLHNLEEKFTEINMHKLGFTSLMDVYYRCKYTSFAECLTQNEFVGEEKYIDNRKFELNMESRAFAMEVENLERYLHWIPLSKYKFINLESPRYTRFAEILTNYRNRIIELCEKQFVTPFSLKNMVIGIPEIDEDDYGLEFYDAMLIASRANHQTLARHRFYFIPSDNTSFNSSAPEFIRFLVYNNNGSASIDELQAILESEYGIRADLSAIRNQVKLSTCVFSVVTDSAYLDDEMYMEALKNEPN